MSSGDQLRQQAQGARPKTRQWNSHWNSTLSAQGFDCGQPPSSSRHDHEAASHGPDLHTEYRQAIRTGRGRFPAISRGLSESSLVNVDSQRQPKNNQRRHFHRRLQQTSAGVRRGSSSADVSSFSSSSSINSINQDSVHLHGSNGQLSSNSHNSNSSGISVLLRWFRRRGNGNQPPAKGVQGQPLSVQSSPVTRRSRTPISVSLERVNQLGTGDSDASDTCLSAAGSFAFLSGAKDSLLVHRRTAAPPVAPPRASSGATLRRKYGLYLPGDVPAPESSPGASGGADMIRALRTEWETHLKEAESRADPHAIQRQPSQSRGSFNSRKKRPAPPPPSSGASGASVTSSQPPSARNSLVSDQTSSSTGSRNPFSFSHVPGKRRAPSPPSVERPPRLNIPPPEASPSLSGRSIPQTPPVHNGPHQPHPSPQLPPQARLPPQPIQHAIPAHPPAAGGLPQHPSPFSSLRRKKAAPRLPELPPVDPKWNDLNSNLDGSDSGSQKSVLLGYNDVKLLDPCNSQTMQNKAELYDKKIPAARLPPADEWTAAGGAAAAAPCNDILKLEHGILRPVAASICSTSSSATEQGRLTLPLKPWYKRHAGSRSAQALSPTAEKRKWKDPFNLEDWMPDVPYYRRSVFLQNSSTLRAPKTPPVVMRDTTRSASASEKRRSLLANISELDREAAQIIQKEKEKEMMRKMVADAKFYSGDDASSAASSASGSTDSPRTSARQLIHMFNSFNQTKVTVNPNFVADSPRSTPKMEHSGAAGGQSPKQPKAKNSNEPEAQKNFTSVTQITADDVEPVEREEVKPVASVSSTPHNPHASNSIFEPKFSLLTSSPKAQPRTPLTVTSEAYPGGARPKTTVSPPESAPESSADALWACKVCTLLNKNIRLWCEVCSALRPTECLPPDFQASKSAGSRINVSNNPPEPQVSKSAGIKESIPAGVSKSSTESSTSKSAGSQNTSAGGVPKLSTESPAPKSAGTKEPVANGNVKVAAEFQASKSAGSKESVAGGGLKTAEPKKWEEEIKKYFGAAPSATASAVTAAPAAAKNSNESAASATAATPAVDNPTPAAVKPSPSAAILEQPEQATPSARATTDVQGSDGFHPDPEALRQARLAFFSNRSGCSSPSIEAVSGTPPATIQKASGTVTPAAKETSGTSAVPVTKLAASAGTVSIVKNGVPASAESKIPASPGTVNVVSKSTVPGVIVTSGNISVVTKVTTTGTSAHGTNAVPAVNRTTTAGVPVVSKVAGTTFVTVPAASGTASVSVSIVNGTVSSVPVVNGGVSSVPVAAGTAVSESVTGTDGADAIHQVTHRPRTEERFFSNVFQETLKSSKNGSSKTGVQLSSKTGHKVSSGCQTNVDSLRHTPQSDPIRTHPLPAPRKSRMTFQPMPCELFAQKVEATVDHDDDVTCSTQLDNLVRQRKAQPKESAHPADDGANPEKRVEDLLSRLEESISSGQFDKAAVLAKELAAIKAAGPKVNGLPPKLNRSESLPAENRAPVNGVRKGHAEVNGRSPSLEPPAVQSKASHVVTPVVQPVAKVNPPASGATKTVVVVKETTPLAKINETEVKPVKSMTTVVTIQANGSAARAQNGNPISKPSVQSSAPLVNGVKVNAIEGSGIKVTVKNVETALEPTPKVVKSPPPPAEAIAAAPKVERIKSPDVDSAIYGPSSSVSSVSSSSISQESRVSVKNKAKSTAVKVDSEQQTAISYQRPAAAKEEIKDPSFNVDVFIEDRLSQKGPFRVNVRPDTTLGQLKSLMETRHQIDVKIQRWIIERRLATDEQQTLQLYGLSAENSSAFLYLVAPEPESPPVVEKSPEPPVVMEEPPAEGRQPLPPPPFYHPRQYYNWEEDRYSICSTDESDVDMDNIDSGGVTTGTDDREDESSSLREDSDKQVTLPTPAPPAAAPEPAPQVPAVAPAAVPAVPEPPAASPVAPEPPAAQENLPDALNVPEVPAETAEEAEVPAVQEAPIDQVPPEDVPAAFDEPEAGAAAQNVPAAPVVPEDPPGAEAEAVADAGTQEAAAKAADGWICPQCTLLNPLNRPGCEVCATARPADVVLPAGMADEEAAAAEAKPEAAAMTEDYQRLINIDQSDAVPNGEPFDCPVCLMNVPAGIGVTLRDCLHTFCKDCLAHVIEFSDDAVVGCPYRDDDYACDSTMQEREIKALVLPEIYEKHLARSMKLAEKQMKNAFHCQTPNCSGWCIIEDNVNNFRCPVCRHVNCLTCQAIHEGVNCKQYQDRVVEDAESNEDAKQTKLMIDALVASGEALSCPQCQVILMKRWGCDWVRCSVCRTEICWVTRQARWGPKGKGDTSGGCRCQVGGIKCHPLCNYCH